MRTNLFYLLIIILFYSCDSNDESNQNATVENSTTFTYKGITYNANCSFVLESDYYNCESNIDAKPNELFISVYNSGLEAVLQIFNFPENPNGTFSVSDISPNNSSYLANCSIISCNFKVDYLISNTVIVGGNITKTAVNKFNFSLIVRDYGNDSDYSTYEDNLVNGNGSFIIN